MTICSFWNNNIIPILSALSELVWVNPVYLSAASKYFTEHVCPPDHISGQPAFYGFDGISDGSTNLLAF